MATFRRAELSSEYGLPRATGTEDDDSSLPSLQDAQQGSLAHDASPGVGGSVTKQREMEFPVTAHTWESGLGQAPRGNPRAVELSQQRE